MKIKIPTNTTPDVLGMFAKTIGSKIDNGRVTLSPPFGQGYVQGVKLNAQMRMIIRNYVVYEDIVITGQSEDSHEHILIFNFRNVIRETDAYLQSNNAYESPSVQVTTQGLNGEMFIPRYVKHRSIIIAVDSSYVRDLIEARTTSTVLQKIVDNEQVLLFEHLVSLSLLKIIQEIISPDVPAVFATSFYRIKAEELICRLLIELVKREETPVQALNGTDIKAIYLTRDALIQDLKCPPVIRDLAFSAGMSESKIRRIFKQVFGQSMFEYYQYFRMKEAARLLVDEKYSVAETGYLLGFTNMSHFTKVFEAQIGVKPKKYSMQ